MKRTLFLLGMLALTPLAKGQLLLEVLEAHNNNTQTPPIDEYPPDSHYRGIVTTGCGGPSSNMTYNITVNIREAKNYVSTHHFRCKGNEYILDCAEKEGIDLPYASRAGASPTEIARLVYGMVDNGDGVFLDPLVDWPKGWFLTDTSYACSDIEFDAGSYMEQIYIPSR